MAKSKNATRTNGAREAAEDTPNHAAVGAPLQPKNALHSSKLLPLGSSHAPAPQPPGRPRKKSRRGQGGGPKTKACKAKVGRNAIKHGIHAIHPVVIADFESVEEWDDFYEGYRESLLGVG